MSARVGALERERQAGRRLPEGDRGRVDLGALSDEELDFLEHALETVPAAERALGLSPEEVGRRLAEWQEARRAQP
jgi:hypothetical protein